jgi:hypothetical protein
MPQFGAAQAGSRVNPQQVLPGAEVSDEAQALRDLR